MRGLVLPKLLMSYAVLLGGLDGSIPAKASAVRIPHAVTMDTAKPTTMQQAIRAGTANAGNENALLKY